MNQRTEAMIGRATLRFIYLVCRCVCIFLSTKAIVDILAYFRTGILSSLFWIHLDGLDQAHAGPVFFGVSELTVLMFAFLCAFGGYWISAVGRFFYEIVRSFYWLIVVVVFWVSQFRVVKTGNAKKDKRPFVIRMKEAEKKAEKYMLTEPEE